MKLQINLPNFEGFYGSTLDIGEYIDVDSPGTDDGMMSQDEYDSIDWGKTYDRIGRLYLDKWLEENGEVLSDYGIKLTYVGIDSPAYYNFSTDKLVCTATFNKAVLIGMVKMAVKADRETFDSLIKSKFTSYDGFYSFYSNDPEYWLETLLKDIGKDNVVFELFLEFITWDTDERSWLPYLLESVHEVIEYQQTV